MEVLVCNVLYPWTPLRYTECVSAGTLIYCLGASFFFFFLPALPLLWVLGRIVMLSSHGRTKVTALYHTIGSLGFWMVGLTILCIKLLGRNSSQSWFFSVDLLSSFLRCPQGSRVVLDGCQGMSTQRWACMSYLYDPLLLHDPKEEVLPLAFGGREAMFCQKETAVAVNWVQQEGTLMPLHWHPASHTHISSNEVELYRIV